MKTKRLDVLLVEKGLVESRNLAQRLIMAGEISVNGQRAQKPSQKFSEDVKCEILNKPRFVSRGGYKLEKALVHFSLTNLNGYICADIGASTGGFTDCLLQHDAQLVYAIDVGYGQLADKLRKDKRVVNLERTNVREINNFSKKLDLVSIDASFISLNKILPLMKKWDKNSPLKVIALVKPQFEAGRKIVAKGRGVIRDEGIRSGIVQNTIDNAIAEGYKFYGSIDSPIKGPKGNLESLIYLTLP